MMLFLLVLLLLSVPCFAQANVLTANYDNNRTNANTNETILTPSAVKSGFGLLFRLPVDGQVYAQPLYVSGVDMPGQGIRNVVYIATMHNSVYAFDADPGGSHAPLWRVNLGPPVPTSNYASGYGSYYTDITPECGILSTPVIDLASRTLYAVTANFDGTEYSFSLHALDLATGAEKGGAPVKVQVSVPGKAEDGDGSRVSLDAFQHLQRPALLLTRGIVYLAFGSHGDFEPYHGWIVGYHVDDLGRPPVVFNATPNGGEGSIWQAGRGMAADAAGNLYAVTSNGDYDGHTNFGECFLRLNSSLEVQDHYIPSDWLELNDADNDLGSAGAILMPRHKWILGGSKAGLMYAVDRTRMGGLAGATTRVFRAARALVFSMALWDRTDGPLLYVQGLGTAIHSFRMDPATEDWSAATQAADAGTGVPFAGFAISAHGSDAGTGILWMTSWDDYGLQVPGTLHAYDASDLSSELWNSSMSPADRLGNAAKFVAPTIANGRVYVPTFSNEVVVYGLQSADQNPPLQLTLVNAGSYLGGGVSPGEVVQIYASSALLGGGSSATVSFDGTQASVLWASDSVWTVIVPYSVANADATNITVSNAEGASVSLTLPVLGAHPGLYSRDGSGMWQGLINNADGTANSPDAPAAPGSVVGLYATGVGATIPANDSADPLTPDSDLPVPTLPLAVYVAGQPAEVVSASGTAGLIGAVISIRVRLPQGLPPDENTPVILQAGDVSSQTVTVVVGPGGSPGSEVRRSLRTVLHPVVPRNRRNP